MKISKALKLKKCLLTLAIVFAMLAVIATGCTINSESGSEGNEGHEAGSEQGESGNEGGEEAGNKLTLSETYDFVRKGARLVMCYDKTANSFKGTVENTTQQTLQKVRVEVHLSNGTELGPTTPIDLPAGKSTIVTLAATNETFDGWTPHAEVGASEHGSSGEGSEGNESGSEHGSTGGEGNEEDGTKLTLTETYDSVRNGARLVMNYDKASNSFTGTVENTTNQTLKKVRVEVHLSNGTELGPSTPVDLAPGQSTDVTLKATQEMFDGWTPHAEVGSSGS